MVLRLFSQLTDKIFNATRQLSHIEAAPYLAKRKQRVVKPGACSDWLPVMAGGPQGSILGPPLFFLYINIEDNINSTIRLFADDTSLYFMVDNPHMPLGI